MTAATGKAGGRSADTALEVLLDEPGFMVAFQRLLDREQPLPVPTQAAHLLAALCSSPEARNQVQL